MAVLVVLLRRTGSVVKGSFGEMIVSDRLPATVRSRLFVRLGRFFSALNPMGPLGSDEVDGPRLKGIESYFPDGGLKNGSNALILVAFFLIG